MYTINDVKSKLIDYLMSVDLAGLTMMDLSGYTGIVCQVNGMDKEDYMATLAKIVASGYKFGDKPEEKEAADNA